VKESSLQKLLQEITEEEIYEAKATSPTDSNNTSGIANQSIVTEDPGSAIHHFVLSSNSIKSSELCLLGLYSSLVRFLSI
jgi:hypothetical protein